MSNQSRNTRSVLDVLMKIGPALSGEICKELQFIEEVSAATARKRLERSIAPLALASVPIVFPRNERFYYLDKQANTAQLKDNLRDALNRTHSLYRLPLSGIGARGGAIPSRLLETFSGLPFQAPNGLDTHDIVKVLLDLELVFEIESEEDNGSDSYYSLSPHLPQESKQIINSRLILENVVLDQVREWAKKLSFVSYGAARVREDDLPPSWASHKWDLSAPSYVFPFCSDSKRQREPGFFLLDVILGRVLSYSDMEYFVQKSRSVHANPKFANSMTMLMAAGFDGSARKFANDFGIVTATPENIFGMHFAEILASLESKLDHFDMLMEDAPDVLPRVLQTASNMEQDGGLRGFAFELFTAWLAKEEYGGEPRLRVPLHLEPGKNSDTDVFLRTGRKLFTFECKGLRAGKPVPEEDITDWIQLKIPALRKQFNRDAETQKLENRIYCFWTTGVFSDESMLKLENLKAQRRTSAETFLWLDGAAIYTMARKVNKEISNVFKECFQIAPNKRVV